MIRDNIYEYENTINRLLVVHESMVELDAQNNLLSRAVLSEDFYCDLLNTLMGWSLKNANIDKKNAAGIDLIDPNRGVVVQVSVTCDHDKIQSSIDKFNKYKPSGIQNWHFYFVPLKDNVPHFRKDFAVPNGVDFNISTDVFTKSRVLQLAKTADPGELIVDKLERVNNTLEKLVREEQNKRELREKLDELLANTWKSHRSYKLMQTDDIDRKQFPGVREVTQFESLGKRKNEDAESPVWTIIRESWKETKNRPVMIEGKGGIGKTVTLFSLINMDKASIPAPAVYVPMFELVDDSGDIINLTDYFQSADHFPSLTKKQREGISSLAFAEWINGPSLLVLLDGFNEVPGKYRWEVLKMLRDWHGKNHGAQLIAVSRPMDNLSMETTFGDETIAVTLSELTKETVTDILKGIKDNGVRVPDDNDQIWETIVYPLFLNLYIKTDRLRDQRAWKDYPLDIREATGRGSLIWNYMQRELLRQEDENWILRCALACEYFAPIIAHHMLQCYDYTIGQREAVEVIQKAAQEMDLNRMPDHVMALFSHWESLDLSMELPQFLKELNWPDIVLRECGLLMRYKESQVINSKNRRKAQTTEPRFEFLHQTFRDCLAGLFLVGQSEISEENSIKEHWSQLQSDLALNYAAELIDLEVLDELWSINRESQKTENKRNHTATVNLLELYKRDRKLAKELDFSGMDLRGLSLTNYLGKNGEALPLFRKASLSNGTRIDRTTFQSRGHSGGIAVLAILPDGRVVSGSYDNTLRVWDAASGQCLQTLEGHTDAITCVAVIPNGRVVSGSRDKTLRVWDAASGQCLQTLEGHNRPVTCIAVLPDGRVVSGSGDDTLRVWDAASGQCLQTMKGYSRGVNCIAVLLDGRVVSGSYDHPLRVWDPASGQCLQILEGHDRSVHCLTILPDGHVVSGSTDRTLRVWDAASGQCLQTLEGHTYPVNCAAALPNGRVVSGSYDNTLRVWDAASGQCLQTLKGHSSWVSGVAVLPDGRVISGSWDNTLRLWDASSGQCIQTLRGHSGPVTCVAVLPDGRVISGSFDNTLRLWDAASGQCLKTLEGHKTSVKCVAALPDGRMVCGSADHTLRLWEAASGQCLHTLKGHSSSVKCAAVLPNGRVVSGSNDETLRLWDAASGQCLQTLEGHLNLVTCVAVLPDGRVISGSFDNTLRVWDAASGQCLQTLKGHSSWVLCVTVLPDGRVVSGSEDKTLRVWDAASGQCLLTLKGHSYSINCVAVLPDGRMVSGSEDNTLRLWDASSGQCMQTLRGHSGPVTCVAVLPDGRVASGSGDDTLRVWDAASGQCLKTLKGHSSSINCIAVLPDGRMISGSDDHTLRVWDAASGQCLRTLEGHTYPVNCVAVLDDGRVVSGSEDNTLRVWDPNTGLCLDKLEGMEVQVSGQVEFRMDFSKSIIDEDLAQLLWHNGAIISEQDYKRWVAPYRKQWSE